MQEVYGNLTEIYEAALISIADIQPFLRKTINNRKTTESGAEENASKMKHRYLRYHYTRNEAENVILFSLECLSNLINAKGSVLSMWALDPSIFSLLVNHSGLLEKVSNYIKHNGRSTTCIKFRRGQNTT